MIEKINLSPFHPFPQRVMHPAVRAGLARDNGVLAMPKFAGKALSYPANFHASLFPLAEMAVR